MHSQKYYEKKLKEIQALKQKPALKPEEIEKVKKEDIFKNRILILGTNPLQDILPLQIKPTPSLQSKDDIENYKIIVEELPDELRKTILEFLGYETFYGNDKNRLSYLTFKYPPKVIQNKLLSLPITSSTIKRIKLCKKYYTNRGIPYDNHHLRKKQSDFTKRVIQNLAFEIDYVMKDYKNFEFNTKNKNRTQKDKEIRSIIKLFIYILSL